MSDEQQPRPRYGEYAPGYVPGQEAAVPPDSTPPPVAPAPAPWTAGPQPGYPQPGAPGFVYQPPGKKRNTVDLVVTIILLVMGLIGALVGVVFGIALSDPAILQSAFERGGYGEFHGTPGAAPWILVASHVILYLAAAGLSILSIARKRISFWIPLVAGVIAAIFFWACYIAVLASDPTLLQRAGG